MREFEGQAFFQLKGCEEVDFMMLSAFPVW
jgi:hypothetical protein